MNFETLEVTLSNEMTRGDRPNRNSGIIKKSHIQIFLYNPKYGESHENKQTIYMKSCGMVFSMRISKTTQT